MRVSSRLGHRGVSAEGRSEHSSQAQAGDTDKKAWPKGALLENIPEDACPREGSLWLKLVQGSGSRTEAEPKCG